METLYELADQLKNFDFKIDEETGEVLNADELNELNMKFAEKVENIIKYVKNLDAEAEVLQSEIESLRKRQQVKENKAEALKKYLTSIMQSQNCDKMEFPCGVASFRKSNAVEVDTEFLQWAKDNASEYVKVKYDIDKTAVKDAIKKGSEFEFARLVEKNNLQIK